MEVPSFTFGSIKKYSTQNEKKEGLAYPEYLDFDHELQYHESWDCLIPVYHKCQDTLGETTDIYKELFHGIILFSNIIWLYEAILLAIEWIKENK